MSEPEAPPSTPLYERNSVLWLATFLFGLVLFLLQPFMDKTWPLTVRAWLALPDVRFTLTLVGYAAVFAGGYVLGRRRRPYSGPLTNVDAAPSAPVVPVAPEDPPDDGRGVTWDELHADEQMVLAAMFNEDAGWFDPDDVARFRSEYEWAVSRWNAALHILDERNLVRDTGAGIVLTTRGRRVAARKYRDAQLDDQQEPPE